MVEGFWTPETAESEHEETVQKQQMFKSTNRMKLKRFS